MAMLARQLAGAAPQLRSRPIIDFRNIVNLLTKHAFAGPLYMFNVHDASELDTRTRALSAVCIVGDLNEVLSLDYPYIIALVDIANEPGNLFFGCFMRKHIPGHHDIITESIVPIVFVSSRSDLSFDNPSINRVLFVTEINDGLDVFRE